MRVKGEFPAAKVKLDYVNYPLIHEEFIPRELDPDPLRQKIEKLVDTYSDPLLAASHDEALESVITPKKESVKPDIREKESIEFL